MPAAAPPPTPQTTDALNALGVAVRRRRKALGISAVAAAEAAGISRPICTESKRARRRSRSAPACRC